MQAASDALLGWGTNPQGQHLYFRHFRDWKSSVDVSKLNVDGLCDYGRICGWMLAKAHARYCRRRHRNQRRCLGVDSRTACEAVFSLLGEAVQQ